MKSKHDLYEILGFERGAFDRLRDEEIEYHVRRSYRREAKRFHPDKGGTREEFEMLATALVVLSDPKRRKHYDETGEIGETPVDNDVADAITQIGKIITMIIAAMTEGAPIDDKDVVRHMIEQLNEEADKATREIGKLELRLMCNYELEKRFARKAGTTGVDISKLAFSGYRAALAEEKKVLQRKVDSKRLAAKLLADFTYDWTPPPQRSGMDGGTDYYYRDDLNRLAEYERQRRGS